MACNLELSLPEDKILPAALGLSKMVSCKYLMAPVLKASFSASEALAINLVISSCFNLLKSVMPIFKASLTSMSPA